MNTNRFLVFAVIATTLLCAALVWSNIVSVGRVRELQDQLDAKQAELLTPGSDHSSTDKSDPQLLLAQRDADYAKLKDEYDKLKQSMTNAVPVATVSTNDAPPRLARGQRGGPNNPWMERLRLQDPERYKQMMAARDQRRQQMEEQYQEQMASLENRIQTAPTQEEVDLASQIADTLDKLGQLRQQMQALRDLPPDQQQAQMAELGPQLQALRQQLGVYRDQDRTLQYTQLADQLGLKGQDAQALIQGIPQILQNTRYTPPGQGGPSGFGGFGGGNAGNTSGTGSAQPQPSSSSTTTK